MYECRMGQVEQIIDKQHPIAVIPRCARDGCPFRIIEPGKVRDQPLIHAVGISRPDPDEFVFLNHGIGPDHCTARYVLLARDIDADPTAVKPHTVVATDDTFAINTAQRHRCEPVGAAILDRRRDT